MNDYIFLYYRPISEKVQLRATRQELVDLYHYVEEYFDTIQPNPLTIGFILRKQNQKKLMLCLERLANKKNYFGKAFYKADNLSISVIHAMLIAEMCFYSDIMNIKSLGYQIAVTLKKNYNIQF